MPVQYTSVISESLAVRSGAGMFDVSHMGRAWIRGEHALPFLEQVTTNDVSKLEDGGSQYSLICYEDGGVVDDIILYRSSETAFRAVINASNRAKDIDWLQSRNQGLIEIEDETERTAMIAVQGPSACEIVAEMTTPGILSTPRFHSIEADVAGARCFAGRTGYTGEDGFELILAAADAPRVWNRLLESGVVPCGLASRDVLRVEAGLPLYGHEISEQINPIEAGLGWVCSKTKDFTGSPSIHRMREEGAPRKLMGIRMGSKLVPREGYSVYVKGEPAGAVTSGAYSPTLDCGIAFALLQAASSGQGGCEIEVRDRLHPATIVGRRFLVKPS